MQNDKQRYFFEVDNVEKLDNFYEYEFGIFDINVKERLKSPLNFRNKLAHLNSF